VRRRYSLLAGFAAALALASAGCRDTVLGTVQNTSGLAGRVDAQSGPSGEQPSGTAVFGSPDSSLAPQWDLEVTCLSVSGKTAIVGFTGTLTTYFGWGESYPTAGLIRAVDGGGTGSGLDSLEFASVEGPEGGAPIPGPTTCSSYPGPYTRPHGPIVNNQGDLAVTDGPPLPESKADCAGAGWRTYGFFTSEAGCVSFAARFGG
jgi:hypothetical protein